MWGFIITSVIDVLKLVVKKWHCFPQRHFNPNTNRVNGKSVYSTETANCAATALPAAWWLYLFKYSSVEYVYSLQRLPFKHFMCVRACVRACVRVCVCVCVCSLCIVCDRS